MFKVNFKVVLEKEHNCFLRSDFVMEVKIKHKYITDNVNVSKKQLIYKLNLK